MSKHAKATVTLGGGDAPRASKIRRDPPPVAKKAAAVRHRSEGERQAVVIGITAFALAIFIIILGFSSYYLDQGPERVEMRF